MDSWMWKHEKNNHLNRKTLKLFKPKFLTLSVRNTAMLIASETCLNAMNIMPQFDYTSKLLFLEKKKKKKKQWLDPRTRLYSTFPYNLLRRVETLQVPIDLRCKFRTNSKPKFRRTTVCFLFLIGTI